jgi:hypothetical protein
MPERRNPFPKLSEDHGLDDMSGDLLGGIAANIYRTHIETSRKLALTRLLSTCLVPLLEQRIKNTQNNPEGTT